MVAIIRSNPHSILQKKIGNGINLHKFFNTEIRLIVGKARKQRYKS